MDHHQLAPLIALYVFTSLVAGLLGGAAMQVAMWLITRSGWAKGDMILALGSLLTKSRANATMVGRAVHLASAVAFAFVYALLMLFAGFTALPQSLMLGIGIGFAHGMIVSLILIWVVADHHPLEEFREADLAIGLSHLVGHIAYGAFVGVAVGVSPF